VKHQAIVSLAPILSTGGAPAAAERHQAASLVGGFVKLKFSDIR